MKPPERAKHHILDTMAAMISGSNLIPGHAPSIRARVRGTEIPTVVASNILWDPIEAALTHGMLAHADETDDSHSPFPVSSGCA